MPCRDVVSSRTPCKLQATICQDGLSFVDCGLGLCKDCWNHGTWSVEEEDEIRERRCLMLPGENIALSWRGNDLDLPSQGILPFSITKSWTTMLVILRTTIYLHVSLLRSSISLAGKTPTSPRDCPPRRIKQVILPRLPCCSSRDVMSTKTTYRCLDQEIHPIYSVILLEWKPPWS